MNNMQVEHSTDYETGVTKTMIGNYTVRELSTNEDKRTKQIVKKKAINEIEYYEKCLPAQVQLAEKQRRRGKRVETGERLPFVVIDNFVLNDLQCNKLEEFTYYLRHADVLQLDYYYYLKSLSTAVDQLINTAYQTYEQDILKKQYLFRYKVHRKVLEELKSKFAPEIKVV